MLYEVITRIDDKSGLEKLIVNTHDSPLQPAKASVSSCGQATRPFNCSLKIVNIPFFGPGSTPNKAVITSYSIHYTKLYEGFPGGDPVAAPGGLVS